MSLTRDEWLKMWSHIRIIETETRLISRNVQSKEIILERVAAIKKQIQSVVGQLE